jgi:DNA-binding Lrp family transcriptional regulator
MEVQGSTVAPMLFRSDQQHTLLCFLFVLAPNPMTLTELAKATGISVSTVAREVARLETSQIVVVETIGRAKRATPNWTSPLARPLQMLLTQTCGPLCELGAIYQVSNVREVVVFGSWADRYQGTAGPYPNDVDVAVIGNGVDLLAIHQVCAQVSRNLQHLSGGPALEINPVIFPSLDWDHPQPDSLAERLKTTGQLVNVHGPVEFVPSRTASMSRAIEDLSVSDR